MAKRTWARRAAVAAAASSLGIGGWLLACKETKTEEMNRGVAVDDEVNMPESAGEMEMTEEERRAKAAAQDEALEQKEFEDSGQGSPQGAPE